MSITVRARRTPDPAHRRVSSALRDAVRRAWAARHLRPTALDPAATALASAVGVYGRHAITDDVPTAAIPQVDAAQERPTYATERALAAALIGALAVALLVGWGVALWLTARPAAAPVDMGPLPAHSAPQITPSAVVVLTAIPYIDRGPR